MDTGAQQLRGPCWLRGVTSSPAEPGPRPPSWGLGARLHCTVWGSDLAMETVGLVFHPQGRTRSPNLEVTQMSFKQQMDKPRPRPQPNTARLRDGERRAPDAPRHLHLGRSHPLRQHKAGSDARGTATFDTGTHQAAPLLGSGSRGTALETLTQPRPEVLKSQRDREGGREELARGKLALPTCQPRPCSHPTHGNHRSVP